MVMAMIVCDDYCNDDDDDDDGIGKGDCDGDCDGDGDGDGDGNGICDCNGEYYGLLTVLVMAITRVFLISMRLLRYENIRQRLIYMYQLFSDIDNDDNLASLHLHRNAGESII